MAHDIDKQLEEITVILAQHPEGLSRGDIEKIVSYEIDKKTLQRRLARLCETGKARMEGRRRAAKYYPTLKNLKSVLGRDKDIPKAIFTAESLEALEFLETPPHAREKVSYKREILESYVPNETTYVPKERREQLAKEGARFDEALAAGTYAKQICQRLLIDLSYNSSRLEGNTYSILDTQRLIEEGLTPEGKVREESVMIMNHKEAIMFLVENAKDIELNPFTIFNLHNLLSQDLLANPASCGNVRQIEVDIGGSTYKPLGNQHVLKEVLELLLLKARKIENPFEQSFFVLVHLSYLQAFEDVNKRTSRLACNIPFIKHNLCPLSFVDVSRDSYHSALLVMYETNNITPMLDLFIWAYLRSCSQYETAKKSIGEIDGYRIQYRKERKDVMGKIIKQNLHGVAICKQSKIENSEKFIAMTVTDLGALHAGAIVGLGISESQLENWQKSQNPKG
jgi:Fic family protein